MSSARFAIAVARFYEELAERLLAGAQAAFADAGGVGVEVFDVPGAFELPLAATALAKTRRFACIVALGCVIRGDTPHFDYVAGESASGLQLAALETGVRFRSGCSRSTASSRRTPGSRRARRRCEPRSRCPTRSPT